MTINIQLSTLLQPSFFIQIFLLKKTKTDTKLPASVSLLLKTLFFVKNVLFIHTPKLFSCNYTDFLKAKADKNEVPKSFWNFDYMAELPIFSMVSVGKFKIKGPAMMFLVLFCRILTLKPLNLNTTINKVFTKSKQQKTLSYK